MGHPLVRMADRMHWEFFEEHWRSLFSDARGPMANSGRRVGGLLMLKHMEALSDERLKELWVTTALLPVLLRRDAFPASGTGEPDDADRVAATPGRGGHGVVAHDGGGEHGGQWHDRSCQPCTSEYRLDGDGEEHHASHRQCVVEEAAGSAGGFPARAWTERSSESRAPGSAFGAAERTLCALVPVQANAPGAQASADTGRSAATGACPTVRAESSA